LFLPAFDKVTQLERKKETKERAEKGFLVLAVVADEVVMANQNDRVL